VDEVGGRAISKEATIRVVDRKGDSLACNCAKRQRVVDAGLSRKVVGEGQGPVLGFGSRHTLQEVAPLGLMPATRKLDAFVYVCLVNCC
jgi:hypothetical protein